MKAFKQVEEYKEKLAAQNQARLEEFMSKIEDKVREIVREELNKREPS